MGPLLDTFETPRLVARLPRPSDAARLFAAYTHNANVSRYMAWRHHRRVTETEAFVDGCLAAVQAGTRLPFSLSLRQYPDAPIGMLEARPSAHTIDLGYVLASAHWGQGYMPEAVQALSRWALAQPRFFRVQAFCDTENRASQRTLEKAGFSREGRLDRYLVHPNLGTEPRACFMYARCR